MPQTLAPPAPAPVAPAPRRGRTRRAVVGALLAAAAFAAYAQLTHLGHDHSDDPILVHALWPPAATPESLLAEADAVVRADTVDVVNRQGDAPVQVVTLRRTEVVWGADPGATFTVEHTALPGRVVSLDEPPYGPAESYLLFLRRDAGGWRPVGVDGRLLVRDGRLHGRTHGPAEALNARLATLPAYLATLRADAR